MPLPLFQVVHRCLAHDPELRYANAGEILEDLALPAAAPDQSSSADQSGYRKTVVLATALSALLLVVIAVFAYLQWQRTGSPTAPTPNYRVIILPFTNISEESEDEAYCRGIAELLTSRLASLPGVDVVSSRFLPPGKADQLSTEYLHQKLRIDYVLDGTLFKRGDTFEVTARLTHIADGKYSWTRSYGGRWPEVFQTFDDISDGAVQAMSLIVGTEGRVPSPPARVNPQALDRLMKASFFVSQFWNSHSSSDFEQAEELLSQSLAIDPNYVDAMIEFAQLYRRAAFPPHGNQLEVLHKAAQLADSALALEPENSKAQSVRGAIFVDLGQPRLALKHLRAAQKDGAGNSTTLAQLSMAYEGMGFWESGLAEIEKAIEADPFMQGSIEVQAGQLSRLGRFPAAIQTLETVEQKSGTWRASMAGILIRAGKPDRAAEILKRPLRHEPPGAANVASALEALIQAAHGHKAEAARVLDGLSLNERRRSDYVALLCAAAGKKTIMIDQIEHWTNLSSYRWLINQPLLRPYRNDPEFQELTRRLHRDWQENVTEFGSTLPVKPPKLPSPEEYFE